MDLILYVMILLGSFFFLTGLGGISYAETMEGRRISEKKQVKIISCVFLSLGLIILLMLL